MFKNIFKKNKKVTENKILIEEENNKKQSLEKEDCNKNIENEEDVLSDIFYETDMVGEIKEQNEKNNSILEVERELELKKIKLKKEKAYDYPNTKNSYFENSYTNDLQHDNLLIYGKENYFANQSIFRIIRENLRKGTGLIWFVSQKEFLNVSEMIKSDSEFFGYKNRVFTAFEIKEDFLEKALLLSHVYIVVKEKTFENDLNALNLNKTKLDFLNIKKQDSDFLPIILSSNIKIEDGAEEQIKELNKYNINFLIYIESLHNERAIDRYINGVFNNFLILTKELQLYKHIEDSYIDELFNIENEARVTLVYDKELNKKIEEEAKKMKPMESFFINNNTIKYIKF